MMFLVRKSFAIPALLAAAIAAAFFAGVAATSTVDPLRASRAHETTAGAHSARQLGDHAASGVAYPTDVLRVLDGDTFEARVRVWPGLDITTRVRLRGVDAPELHARCAEERVKAEAARDALASLLAQGSVGITHVGLDKYGGRVLADASTRLTDNVAETLFAAGHARRYGGGHRDGWCPARSS
jgi:endonuclease YncB( thermonuclease family)